MKCCVGLAELEVRTYIAEPDRGPRNWDGKAGGEGSGLRQSAAHSRATGASGLQRQRGERIERNFAHQFDTGGLDRLWVRGMENVHKKFLIQAAACNLALLLRSRYGSGKPRAAHDRAVEVFLMILAVMKTGGDLFGSASAFFHSLSFVFRLADAFSRVLPPAENEGV